MQQQQQQRQFLFLCAFLLGALSATVSVSAQFFTQDDDVVWDVDDEFDNEFDIDDYNVCDLGPDALTNAFGKSIPRTCFDVLEANNDGETIERCYYTYVPDSCRNTNNDSDNDDSSIVAKAPLVVDVHALSSCALYSASYTGWREIADREENCMIVVWPSASHDPDRFATPCFNIPGFLRSGDYGSVNGNNVTTVPCCCFNFGNGILDGDNDNDNANENIDMMSLLPTKEPDDPLFIKMVIDSVVESFRQNGETEAATNTAKTTNFEIDTNRVYMAGHSNGCMTSLAVAGLYSDTIAAVCCHAGTVVTSFADDYAGAANANANDENANTAVPIWMVHGVKDRTIPIDGFAVPIPLLGEVGIWPLRGTINYLADQNGCSTRDEVDLLRSSRDSDNDNDSDNSIVGTVTTHRGCRNNANVEIVTLSDVGHYPYSVPNELNNSNTPSSNSSSGLREYLRGEIAAPIDTTALAWEFCRAQTKANARDSSQPQQQQPSAGTETATAAAEENEEGGEENDETNHDEDKMAVDPLESSHSEAEAEDQDLPTADIDSDTTTTSPLESSAPTVRSGIGIGPGMLVSTTTTTIMLVVTSAICSKMLV